MISEIAKQQQELLHLRKEVADLKKQLERAQKDRTLLLQQVDELSRERKELLATIERAVDDQRVVLPKKAAKALKILLDQFGSAGTLELLLGCRINSVLDAVIVHERAWYKEQVEVLKALQFNLVLEAIVKGFYDPEAKLEEKVSHMLREWVNDEYDGDPETDLERFSKKLVRFMRSELQSG